MSDDARKALKMCIDVIERFSYRWCGEGVHPQAAVDAARSALDADSHAPAQELLGRLLGQLIESGAENYQESVFDVELGSEQLSASVILQHKNKPALHELRMAAEKECQELREQVKRLKSDRSACLAEFKVMSRSVRECERERNELKERLDTALEFLRHVKKCLRKNGEYAPLSHEELDLIIGIHPLTQAALTNRKGEV